VISTGRINYPKVTRPDVLVLMAEEAARTYGEGTAEGAMILVNENLVKTLPKKPGLSIMKVPATAIAEGLGRVIVANIVMLGFIAALCDFVSYDAMKQSILSTIPKGTEKLNLSAFQAGYDHGVALKQQSGKE
jgi:2-oxoglutarate ferredoxin oxidoreductase subunit gamma